jgi:hypothetical protein
VQSSNFEKWNKTWTPPSVLWILTHKWQVLHVPSFVSRLMSQ